MIAWRCRDFCDCPRKSPTAYVMPKCITPVPVWELACPILDSITGHKETIGGPAVQRQGDIVRCPRRKPEDVCQRLRNTLAPAQLPQIGGVVVDVDAANQRID